MHLMSGALLLSGSNAIVRISTELNLFTRKKLALNWMAGRVLVKCPKSELPSIWDTAMVYKFFFWAADTMASIQFLPMLHSYASHAPRAPRCKAKTLPEASQGQVSSSSVYYFLVFFCCCLCIFVLEMLEI